jgi:MFS transporter, MHS family, proline/betaine transporter
MSTDTTVGGAPEVRTPTGDAERATLRRAARASFIGNFAEWFDYTAYGFLATTIAVVFFPNSASGVLEAFTIFALAFVIRPIGGIFWGYIGDRFGRRVALSMSILIMSVATFLIAFIPSYAVIGIGAPLLLLTFRVAQGFSASGEYAGASTFLAEYAPDDKRGKITSLVPASTAAGMLAGSLLVAFLFAVLDDASMQSWGWRIPFLLAGPLGLVGRYIRLKLEDTPKFHQMQECMATAPHSTPIRTLFRDHWKSILIGLGVTCLNAVAFYVVLLYMPTYLHETLDYDQSTATFVSTITLVAYIGSIFVMGTLSDRFGRKRMLILAAVGFILLSVPLVALMGPAGLIGVVLIEVLLGILLTINDGTLPAFLSEIFPTSVRYTGFAFTFNTANALFGGTAPAVLTWLIVATGSPLALGWYLVGAAVIALIAMLMSRETSGTALVD